jgi:hypothetical protein
MEEVPVAVLREDKLGDAERTFVIRKNRGHCLGAPIPGFDEDDLLGRIADRVDPGRQHPVSTAKLNGITNFTSWACAQALPIEIEVAVSNASAVMRFMVVLLFEGISRLPPPRITPLFAPWVKETCCKTSVNG